MLRIQLAESALSLMLLLPRFESLHNQFQGTKALGHALNEMIKVTTERKATLAGIVEGAKYCMGMVELPVKFCHMLKHIAQNGPKKATKQMWAFVY